MDYLKKYKDEQSLLRDKLSNQIVSMKQEYLEKDDYITRLECDI